MKVLVLLLMSGIALVAFTGCEDNEEKNLFKAQECINKSDQNSVSACSSYLSGNNSADAWTLRCSISFISEGIDESTIVDALENIDQTNGSNDPTVTAISSLAMSDTTTSAETVSTCNRSGSESLVALANFANLATATGSVASILNITDDAAREAALQNYVDTYNPATDGTALGSAVISSQESLCNSNDGLMKDTEACDNINDAISSGGSNPDAVADALFAALQNANN